MKRYFDEKLDSWRKKKDRKPLILRGARQVGKTYGVKKWAAKNFERTAYLNFEKDSSLGNLFQDSLSPLEIIKKLTFVLGYPIDPKKDLIFFDEIQNCGRALNSLKYFQEELPQQHIIAAGSLLGVTLNTEPFPVGKVEFLDIFPMSFGEFLEAKKKQDLLKEIWHTRSSLLHLQALQLLKEFLIVGGSPEIVSAYINTNPQSISDYDLIRKKQDDLIRSHMADMAKHCGKVNSMHLERLWRNIPEQLARTTNKRFVFKDVIPKMNKYQQIESTIDWLEAAGLIFRVPVAHHAELPLSAYAKESFFKLYIYDVGLLGALSNLSPASLLSYDYGTFKGFFLENFVLQELITAGQKKVFSWAESTSELDFLCDFDGQLTPIEVKAGINLKAKSLGLFIRKYKTQTAYRLSAENFYPSKSSIIKDWPIYFASQICRR